MREKLNKDMSFMNKGFTFRSGPVKKKVNSYSSFWDSSTDNYNVDEFKNTRRNRIKAIEKIEQFVNDRSKKMSDIPILQNQKVWTTLKFSDGSYSSSRVVNAGSDINVGGIWADYDAKGDARRVVGFSFSFTPLG